MAERLRGPASGDFNFHPADFVLDAAKQGMLAEIPQVGIPGEPAEVAITERQRLGQRRGGELDFIDERVTAGEVVKHQRIAWLESRQTLIHFEAFLKISAPSVVIPEKLQGFDVLGIAPDHSFE